MKKEKRYDIESMTLENLKKEYDKKTEDELESVQVSFVNIYSKIMKFIKNDKKDKFILNYHISEETKKYFESKGFKVEYNEYETFENYGNLGNVDPVLETKRETIFSGWAE